MLAWTDKAPDRAWLRAHGFALLTSHALGDRVAVVDVELRDLDDLRVLYGFVLEPAWRAGCQVVVNADRPLGELDPAAFVDDEFEYPWTLERAIALAAHMGRVAAPPRGCPDRRGTS